MPYKGVAKSKEKNAPAFGYIATDVCTLFRSKRVGHLCLECVNNLSIILSQQ